MLGITDYLWRLLPANPILVRVVETASKRKRDLIIRCIYLGILIAVVLFALAQSGDAAGTSLSKLTRTSANIFEQMSYLQLGLVALLAPIFTAGAITQEKDSQTYDILLTTPLSNGQIVLGSLMSRLFFILALLISGMPIFSVTQIFGGVAIYNIVLSFLIAAATAFVTGALAMAIATFKVGTRRTIFSFYMFIVLFLVGTLLLDQMSYFRIELIDPLTSKPSGEYSQTSWFTALNPFLALRAIFHDKAYMPPAISLLPESLRGFPTGWMLAWPTTFYISFMFFLSFVLVTPSIVLLRRMAQSTNTVQSWILQKFKLSTGDKTRKPRNVWSNPIAWREAKTKASAARSYLLRYGFIAAGLIGALSLAVLYSRKTPVNNWLERGAFNAADNTLLISGNGGGTFMVDPATVQVNMDGHAKDISLLSEKLQVTSFQVKPDRRGSRYATVVDLKQIPRALDEQTVRKYLLGLVVLEAAVILLIITNAAASTVTREKEDGTLDLLLSTPITSHYYIWGKLRGLVSFVLPLVAVPAVSCVMFVIADIMRMLNNDSLFNWLVLPEAVVLIPLTLIIVSAFAGILGMQMSLRCRTTVRAVMGSVGIMLAICGALAWCGLGFVSTSRGDTGNLSLAFSSFSPFALMAILIAPYDYGGRVFENNDPVDVFTARMVMLVFGLVATGVYAAIVWSMYKSMVKNFDMTIRKQSR
jgi:ABC-type transport system involved in multi-copper enzyme maturation permease subunit